MSHGRLEQVAAEGVREAAGGLLDRAERRLITASAGLGGGDVEGAFVAAYDAYRMAAESLLLRQGLRSTGGEGSRSDVTIEDAVSAQFGERDPRRFAKPIFENFRDGCATVPSTARPGDQSHVHPCRRGRFRLHSPAVARGGSLESGGLWQSVGADLRSISTSGRWVTVASGARAEPVGGPDGGLHGSSQAMFGRGGRRVQLVAVGRSKYQ